MKCIFSEIIVVVCLYGRSVFQLSRISTPSVLGIRAPCAIRSFEQFVFVAPQIFHLRYQFLNRIQHFSEKSHKQSS